MGLFIHWDLFTLVLTIASIGTLGFVVLLNNTRNATNRVFFLFSLITICWGAVNYISYQLKDPLFTLWALRLTIFFALWHAYSFFLLANIFPQAKWKFSSSHYLLLTITLLSSILNLTPYVFRQIEKLGASTGVASITQKGPGIFLFIIIVFFLVGGGIITLIKRFKNSVKPERPQLKLMLIGSSITFVLIFFFNFISPAILNDVQYIPLGALSILPLIVYTSYGIYKYKLFNLKLIATELFVGILSIIFLSRMVLSPTRGDLIIDAIIFTSTTFFGFLLINGIKQEIHAREEVHLLADRLADANQELGYKNTQLRIMDQQKSEFVSIASHQLRTPLTAIKGYTSMLLEDSFGKLTDEQRTPVQKIFLSSERMVEMVADFLNVSKIEQGEMVYAFSVVDIGILLTEMTEEFTHTATKKGITLKLLKEPKKGEFIVFADEGKVRQIFSNLLDNAIKYTEKGWITLDIKENKATKMITVSIADSGVGLSPDDILHLFGKFARGSQGQRQNTGGSGLGLYVVRKMLEAQHGTIRVDSPGLEKGSTFTIELPEGMQSAYATKK